MKDKKTNKAISKLLCAILILIALAATSAALLFFYLKAESSPRDTDENERTYELEITDGMTARKAAEILYENGIIKNEKVFYLFARFPEIGALVTGADKDIFVLKKGIATVHSSQSLVGIYYGLSAGRGRLVQVPIPEGLTVRKIAERLEASGICAADDFKRAAKGDEGFLFPDTYSLSPGMDADAVVKIMKKNFSGKISSIPGLAAADSERQRYIVTLASVIEREYRAEEEAPLIASVFTNRLEHGIGLYSCATVEYVITEVLGRPHPDIITYDDLKIDSPYNTYLNAGLPPGPICNPGLVALKAAAAPAETDYYYFQLMDEDEGRHVFTKTLGEHVKQGAIFKTKRASR